MAAFAEEATLPISFCVSFLKETALRTEFWPLHSPSMLAVNEKIYEVFYTALSLLMKHLVIGQR